MEESHFEFKEVNECENGKSAHNVVGWKPFLKQLFICTGIWTSYFLYGLCIGSPTVIIPQIRKEANSTEAIDPEMASWLSSIYAFSGFPCAIILTILVRFIGRKLCFLFACFDTFVAFLLFFCSTTVTQVLISEIIHGFFISAQHVVVIMILTEYISPRYRGLFLTIKSATFYWGVWVANAVGTFFHWKNIGILGIACATYMLVTVIFWPESPYWLASKGRYKECAKNHRWLKGCDKESEKELETLINTQKEYLKSVRQEKPFTLQAIKDFYTVITSREFYKPTLISILTGILSVFSGKLVCTVYALDIIKSITGSESTAYTGMLILDGVTIISMYAGCFLLKRFKRRSLLLVSSSICIVLITLMSLYLYLIHLSVITENKYVSVCLLVSFSIAVCCGPLLMSTSVYAELIPLRSRNLSVCLIALVAYFAIGVQLKVAPYIFQAFDLHGTFLYFAISSSVCVSLLYLYLPETKDKTLQEIADSINGIPLRKHERIKDTEKFVD